MKRFLILCLILIQTKLCFAQSTVVGIHGLCATWKALNPIRRALQRDGFTICLWDFDIEKKALACHGADLVRLLQQIALENPGEPIHFVTQSIGALILRSALCHPCCPQEALFGRAVLFTPPNQGSILARRFRGVGPVSWLVGESGKELMINDPYQIQELGCFPDSMSVLVLAGCRGIHPWLDGPNDGFLLVEETRLDTPHYHETLPTSHGKLLSNPEALRMTRRFLMCGTP